MVVLVVCNALAVGGALGGEKCLRGDEEAALGWKKSCNFSCVRPPPNSGNQRVQRGGGLCAARRVTRNWANTGQ